MKSKQILLTVALNLTVSAIAAQAADIQIRSLPYTITTPGTYVLTGNLSYSVNSSVGAINIFTTIGGPVVVDLKGFTITGPGGTSWGVTIGVSTYNGVPNAYPITIRNGTIANFQFGITAENSTQLLDITVNNIIFDAVLGTNPTFGIIFGRVASSTITSCTFNDAYYAIEDDSSAGGNSYNNDTFVRSIYALDVSTNGTSSPFTLDRCQFAPAPSN
jgi:hypothetical protein